jgi:parvulin-like peptidyl-prolyl isomerase
MSDTLKSFLFCFIVFILWSGFCFGSGYLLCNRTATKQLERANNELREQQQRYEELIRLADERLQRVKEELYGKITDNGQTITELSGIIEQISQQRIDL